MMLTRPMAMQATVTGIWLPSPRRSDSLRLPARRMSAPAPRKSKSFMTAWLTMCQRPPAVESHVPMPSARAISPICPSVE